MIRVAIYNEYMHERMDETARKAYPYGIQTVLSAFIDKEDDMTVSSVITFETIDLLTDELLDNTDVMLWWGHIRHDQIPDEIAERVKQAVLRGMGIIFLHSSHMAKPFRLLTGASCCLGWRDEGDMERVWVVNPAHPIAAGLGPYFDLPHEETYCEPFGIPEPDELVFIGWYEGGEVFRSGCVYKRGNGRIFYFQPGHEAFPTFYDANVQKVLLNAVRWAVPTYRVTEPIDCIHLKKGRPKTL